MKITVTIKRVYGQALVYPADGPAQVAAQLTGTRTFTCTNLACLELLGHEVEIDASSPEARDLRANIAEAKEFLHRINWTERRAA